MPRLARRTIRASSHPDAATYKCEAAASLRDKVASFCPACVDSAAQDALADQVDANADARLGDFYCASPSGAFLE